MISKQITWIEFLYLEKSWPHLMSNTRFMGPLMVPNDEPKSVNIDKMSTTLHVYYLNFIVNYLNTVQIAQIQAYNFECAPCSDAINGPMNRVFDIKSGHDFRRYRNSIQVIYFHINVVNFKKSLAFCYIAAGKELKNYANLDNSEFWPASLDCCRNNTFQHFNMKICNKEDAMLDFL